MKQTRIVLLTELLLCISLLLAATYFLINGSPQNFYMRSYKELWNLGHIAYFALLTYLLIRLNFLNKLSLPYQWLLYLLFTLLIGTLVEVLQYDTNRTPDVADISRDLTGCLLVLAFNPSLLNSSRKFFSAMIKLAALSILLLYLKPLSIALIDESIARYQFPILSSFSTPFELDRWHSSAEKDIVSLDPESDKPLLKIGLTTERYSGVGLDYFPADWSDYNYLVINLLNPAEKALKLTIRIHDQQHESGRYAYRYHDRFNKKIVLNAGWNEIKIPLQVVKTAVKRRVMDLTAVRNVMLFASSLAEPVDIYMGSIYLSSD